MGCACGVASLQRVANQTNRIVPMPVDEPVDDDDSAIYQDCLSDFGKQQALIRDHIVPILHPIYFSGLNQTAVMSQVAVIGSTGRGTDCRDKTAAKNADLDVAFLKIPVFSQGSDWRGTRSVDIKPEDESKVVEHDDVLAKAIAQLKAHLQEAFKREVKFEYVRAWDDLNGVVFCLQILSGGTVTSKDITLEHGECVDLDINLFHDEDNFGASHTHYFLAHLREIASKHGDRTAGRALRHIREVKRRCKAISQDPKTQRDDKMRKVPGFLVECMFVNEGAVSHGVLSMEDLQLRITKFDPAEYGVELKEKIMNQEKPILDRPLSIEEMLAQCPALTKGGLQTLKEAMCMEIPQCHMED